MSVTTKIEFSALPQLPDGRFQTVVADPPWAFTQRLDARDMRIRGAATKYGTLTIADIKSLGDPLKPAMAENSHLYLWYPSAFAVQAHEVAEAWGFTPKTVMTWVKVNYDGTAGLDVEACRLRIGMGFYFRKCTEHVLFAVRGSMRLRSRNIPDVFFARRGEHSSKPDVFYDIVRRASYTPALELFSRQVRPDFHGWGLEYPEPIEEPAA